MDELAEGSPSTTQVSFQPRPTKKRLDPSSLRPAVHVACLGSRPRRHRSGMISSDRLQSSYELSGR
jgi:hypothetical protein